MHKILLDNVNKSDLWLGITFRKSKTFVSFDNNIAYLSNQKKLTLANQSDRKEFFKLKGMENRVQDFIYPEITYTVSKGDMIKPIL